MTLSYPGTVTLSESFGPTLIHDETVQSNSVITITVKNQYGGTEEDLFYVMGGSIDSSKTGDRNNMDISIKHSFLRDFDSDDIYICRFTIKSLQMVSAREKTITYNGWLSEARFYSENAEYRRPLPLNPFAGIAKDDTNEDLPDFPFLPPVVTMADLFFPMEVQIVLKYDAKVTVSDLQALVIEKAILKEKQVAKEKKEQEESEERKKKIKEDYEEWLKTPEGVISVMDSKNMSILREAVPVGSNFTNVEIEVIKEEVVDHALSLTEQELMLSKIASSRRLTKYGKKNMGRQIYLEIFDKTVNEL